MWLAPNRDTCTKHIPSLFVLQEFHFWTSFGSHLYCHMKALLCIIQNIKRYIITNHLNEHILDKLGETVKRQTEIWERLGREDDGKNTKWIKGWLTQGILPWTLPQKGWWWRPWWCSPPQCRELHSELDNLSEEDLSCLRKLQHCREELNQSQQQPPRVRAFLLPHSPRWWWEDSFFGQILQIKFISPCQHLASLSHSAWFVLYWEYSSHGKKNSCIKISFSWNSWAWRERLTMS